VNQPFRDRDLVASLVRDIRRDVTALGRPVTLMEVCGTHTMAVSRSGLRDLLGGLVELRSGPGCPVCVTAEDDLDRMIALATLPGTTVVTYGDMLRVPGGLGSLEEARTAGADVRVTYSALTAVQTAAAEPERRVIFLGVGFETTAPGAALALSEAVRRGADNFFLYSAHKTLPPALRALLDGSPPPTGATSPGASGDPGSAGPGAERRRVEGFILPGHVSAVLGRRAYEFLSEDYGLPAAVTGFEPVDILIGVRELVRAVARQVRGGARPPVLNLYPRVVRENGNPRARDIVERVFAPCGAEWRGLGAIPGSGLSLRPEWWEYDAAVRFGDELALRLEAAAAHPSASGRRRDALRRACRCGAVLRGEILPPECPLFGRACTPSDPVGPCMVSGEGSCAAYHRYHRGKEAPTSA